MKALITLLFWGSITVFCFGYCICSLIGSPWILAVPLAIISPFAFVGFLIGSAVRRH
jgi:hypothetical protein